MIKTHYAARPRLLALDVFFFITSVTHCVYILTLLESSVGCSALLYYNCILVYHSAHNCKTQKAKQNMQNESQPRIFDLHINPTYAVHIPQQNGGTRVKSALRQANEINLTKNTTNGVLSRKAQRRLMNAVNWLIASSTRKWIFDKSTNTRYSFRVNFITLTLPTVEHSISDHKFKSVLLHAFINACRFKYGLSNYVWKVEAQENGNIHAHFTTDCFIHWKDLRRTWNKILSNHGLIDAYSSKHSAMSFTDYANLYAHRFTDEAHAYRVYSQGVADCWRNPNTTDVKAVFKVKDIAGYLAKYLSKNDEDRRPISGRLWSSSESLASTNKLVVECVPNANADMFRELCKPEITYKQIERVSALSGAVSVIGEIFFFNQSMWGPVLQGALLEVYKNHCFNIRNSGTLVPLGNTYEVPDIQPQDYILELPIITSKQLSI